MARLSQGGQCIISWVKMTVIVLKVYSIIPTLLFLQVESCSGLLRAQEVGNALYGMEDESMISHKSVLYYQLLYLE
jgi:hypothetical protein